MSGRILLLIIFIWAVLFIFIRETIKIGGNPIFNFLLMVLLFFVALFFVKLAIVRFWVLREKIKRGIARFKNRH